MRFCFLIRTFAIPNGELGNKLRNKQAITRSEISWFSRRSRCRERTLYIKTIQTNNRKHFPEAALKYLTLSGR